MTRHDERRIDGTAARLGRREAVKLVGAATLAAVAAGTVGTVGRPMLAQEASPEALPVASPVAVNGLEGRYLVVRLRTLTGDTPVDEVLTTIRDGFMPMLPDIPGFVAYLGTADTNSRESAFAGVFDDQAGADESTTLGAAWLTDNGYDFFEGDPVVIDGEIGVAAGSLTASGLADAYVVIRSRTLKADRSGSELLTRVRDGFLPLVEAVPGFVAYLAVANEATGNQFGIGVYADAAGAAESTRLAAEWGAQGAADFVEGDPLVIEGPIGLSLVGDA